MVNILVRNVLTRPLASTGKIREIVIAIRSIVTCLVFNYSPGTSCSWKNVNVDI